MPWTKLDDGFWSHRKILDVGNDGAGAFARMISYCGAQLSDGVVPDEVARFIAGDESVLKSLLDANLIAKRRDGTWEIHDFLDYQDTRERVEERRELAKSRNREYRERKNRDASRDASNDASVTHHSGLGRVGLESVGEGEGSKGRDEFSDWLSHFDSLTGKSTSPRTEAEFDARRAEGHSLADLKLATAGVHADDWHRERELDDADYILRADKIQRHIGLGRTLAAGFTDDDFDRDTRTGKTRRELGIA